MLSETIRKQTAHLNENVMVSLWKELGSIPSTPRARVIHEATPSDLERNKCMPKKRKPTSVNLTGLQRIVSFCFQKLQAATIRQAKHTSSYIFRISRDAPHVLLDPIVVLRQCPFPSSSSRTSWKSLHPLLSLVFRFSRN